MTENFVFPRGFVWGTATSSYQIEGAAKVDGKGQSIWDTFSYTPGKILTGENGDVACDHYNLYETDFQLAKQLNSKAYRFSVSWPRIYPIGHGKINLAGMDYYDRLVESLLAKGIDPYITLYHWDLPQSLQDKGGWVNRDTAGYFADYAAALSRRFGDRVKNWITINEPWVVASIGNVTGEHAPGVRDIKTALHVGHHLLVGHGLATQAIRATNSSANVGISLSVNPVEAATETAADIKAADEEWNKSGRWFLDPLFGAAYPPKVYDLFGHDLIPVLPNDLALIGQSIDFLGLNYYTRTVLGSKGFVNKVPGSEYTDMGWEVHPPALYRLLMKLNKDYNLPPIFITENGCAVPDLLTPEGHVHDERRIKYMHDHLIAIRRAMLDGVHVRGYFAWSLLDNFEWQHGFSKRFGLIYVDFETQKRYIKDSGYWYAKVIQHNEVHK
jgi:beta-glucosidase